MKTLTDKTKEVIKELETYLEPDIEWEVVEDDSCLIIWTAWGNSQTVQAVLRKAPQLQYDGWETDTYDEEGCPVGYFVYSIT